jgi:PPOX class probable FMN-dependent enzyme
MAQGLEFGRVVDSEDGLAGLYRPPGRAAVNKVRTVIDEGTAAFIDHCTFFVLSTSSADGRCDASPRGGPAGFIQRIGDRHVAFADLNGNNRLDSFRNIVSNPYVGLLLMVPGKDETVRINGRATLTDDAWALDLFTAELRRPVLAAVVAIDELYGHCAKAFRRGNVWRPNSWTEHAEAPDLARMLSCQFDDMEESDVRRVLEDAYVVGLAADRRE